VENYPKTKVDKTYQPIVKRIAKRPIAEISVLSKVYGRSTHQRCDGKTDNPKIVQRKTSSARSQQHAEDKKCYLQQQGKRDRYSQYQVLKTRMPETPRKGVN